MSAISQHAERVNAQFDLIANAVTGLTAAIAGVADDILWLKEKIEELQNNPGPISVEDQALLDAMEARAGTLATNLGALKTALEKLDAATQRPSSPPPE